MTWPITLTRKRAQGSVLEQSLTFHARSRDEQEFFASELADYVGPGVDIMCLPEVVDDDDEGCLS